MAAARFLNGRLWRRPAFRTGGSGVERVPERAVLVVGKFETKEFWYERAPERAFLARAGARTGGSEAAGLERAVLARAGTRRGGSGAAGR